MVFVHPQTAALISKIKAMGAPPMSDLSVEQARAMLDQLPAMMDWSAPDIAKIIDTTAPGPAGRVPVRIYQPTPGETAARPVFVFFHGGGWYGGSIASHHPLCAWIAHQLQMTLVSVGYRLGPEHPFPAFTDDCVAVTQWVASSPTEIGHPIDGIVVGGDSAGGNLSAAVAVDLRGRVNLRAQFLIYPATDISKTYPSEIEFSTGYFLEKADVDLCKVRASPKPEDWHHPRLSPLLAADLSGLAPAVIVGVGLDPIRDQARAYAAALIQAGNRVSYHELPGLIHGCFCMRKELPVAQEALVVLLNDLRSIML
jgi:acetyl esterase